MHDLFFNIVSNIIFAIEIIGVVVVLFSVIKSIKNFIFDYKFDFEKYHNDTNLNNGISTGLEILLAGEVLNTVLSQDINDLIYFGVLVAIRSAIAILVHWEGSHKHPSIKPENLKETDKKFLA